MFSHFSNIFEHRASHIYNLAQLVAQLAASCLPCLTRLRKLLYLVESYHWKHFYLFLEIEKASAGTELHICDHK